MRQTRFEKRQALLQDFRTTREEILKAAARWPADRSEEPFLGSWSILDLLAHLTGWDFSNRAAVDAVLHGSLPDFYQFQDRDWQTYNADLVRQYRVGSLQDQLQQARASQDQLLEQLEQVSAEDFTRDTSVRYKGIRVTIARLVDWELRDEKEHLAQLRSFVFNESGEKV